MVFTILMLAGCGLDDIDEPPADHVLASRTAAGIAASCSDADSCESGLECLHYYGIAGAAGDELATCEVRCKVDADCPADRGCVITEGPGRVCR